MAKVIKPCIVRTCEMNIARCDPDGKANPKGTNVRVAKLKLTLDPQYNSTAYIASITLDAKVDRNISSIKDSLCSASGYTETSPTTTFFKGVEFAVGETHQFALIVKPLSTINATEFYQSFTLNRAGCIMDFSPSGSVAVGTFVSDGSRDGFWTKARPEPRFEVASNYKSFFMGRAYFLGGIEGVTTYDLGTPMDTGGRIDSNEVYRYVWRLEKQNAGTQKKYEFHSNFYANYYPDPILLHGAARTQANGIIPLPYVGNSDDKFVKINLNALQELVVETGPGTTIELGYIIFEYIDSHYVRPKS